MADQPSLFEFGPYRVDARRRLVWRSGDLLNVPPRAVELLSVLVDQAGEVVPKDDLLRRVWPDTFVEEANLSVNVSILRKALGERPDGQDYIQTVARRGYRFVGRVTRAETRAPRALAVLPFRPLALSPAGEGADLDEAVGLGLADAVISRLAATGRILVRPTAAIRRFGASDVDAVEAGRQLQVDAILDARYRRIGAKLQVSAQLVPVDGSSPLWAERFDETVADVFTVEDAIAQRLAASLVVELTGDERRRLGRHHTDNVEAWQAYARGRFFWGRFSRSWIEKAMTSFEQAARLDPGYALPHAGLADVFLVAGVSGAVRPKDAWARAARAIEQGRERDEDLPELHLSAAFLHLFRDWDWGQAEAHFLRAVELAPLTAAPHQWRGLFLGLQGRYDEGRSALARAVEIDPLSPVCAGLSGLLLAFEGRHRGEVEQQRRTVELDPQHFVGHWALGGALLNTGEHAEALAELQQASELAEGTVFLTPFLGRAHAMAGRAREARTLLKRMPRQACYQRAALLLALGEARAALKELRAACDAREAWVVALGSDPAFTALRDDAGFQALVSRVRGKDA